MNTLHFSKLGAALSLASVSNPIVLIEAYDFPEKLARTCNFGPGESSEGFFIIFKVSKCYHLTRHFNVNVMSSLKRIL